MGEEGWKQSSGEGREEKQREVYLDLSEAAVVKFNVAVGTEFNSVFRIIREVASRSIGVNQRRHTKACRRARNKSKYITLRKSFRKIPVWRNDPIGTFFAL